MKVEIYGTAWCTFCKQAVSLCESKGIEYDYIDVDDSVNMRLLEEKVGSRVRSVPQIFVDNRYLSDGFGGLKRELNSI